MRLTKRSLACLNASNDDRLTVLADILRRSAVICGEPGKYEIVDPNDEYLTPAIYNVGEREYISGSASEEYQRRIVAGLATRYPKFISGTFTHGLNGVEIYDVNNLIRAIVEDDNHNATEWRRV